MKKICPFMRIASVTSNKSSDSYCCEDECALYLTEFECCAILDNARSSSETSLHLEDISEKLDKIINRV